MIIYSQWLNFYCVLFLEHSSTLKNIIRSKNFAVIKTPDPSVDVLLSFEYYAPSELGLKSATEQIR